MLFHVVWLGSSFLYISIPLSLMCHFPFPYTATFSMTGVSVCWTRNKKGTSISKMMSKVRDQNSKLLCLWCPKLSPWSSNLSVFNICSSWSSFWNMKSNLPNWWERITWKINVGKTLKAFYNTKSWFVTFPDHCKYSRQRHLHNSNVTSQEWGCEMMH